MSGFEVRLHDRPPAHGGQHRVLGEGGLRLILGPASVQAWRAGAVNNKAVDVKCPLKQG